MEGWSDVRWCTEVGVPPKNILYVLFPTCFPVLRIKNHLLKNVNKEMKVTTNIESFSFSNKRFWKILATYFLKCYLAAPLPIKGIALLTWC